MISRDDVVYGDMRAALKRSYRRLFDLFMSGDNDEKTRQDVLFGVAVDLCVANRYFDSALLTPEQHEEYRLLIERCYYLVCLIKGRFQIVPIPDEWREYSPFRPSH